MWGKKVKERRVKSRKQDKRKKKKVIIEEAAAAATAKIDKNANRCRIVYIIKQFFLSCCSTCTYLVLLLTIPTNVVSNPVEIKYLVELFLFLFLFFSIPTSYFFSHQLFVSFVPCTE